MKALGSLAIALLLFTVARAAGDEVPFAQRPTEPKGAALDDIMGKIQLQHIKLWQPIKRRNWGLLNYEADHLKESLSDAAIFYVNIPLQYINSADQPLSALQDAVKSKDPSRLARDYAALAAACNSCHQAA